MYQNYKMTEEIQVLQKDLVVHQEVEKELAKRSHFCQKVIDRYKEQIKELNVELKEAKTKGNVRAN
mgnify:CR=1 FL=1